MSKHGNQHQQNRPQQPAPVAAAPVASAPVAAAPVAAAPVAAPPAPAAAEQPAPTGKEAALETAAELNEKLTELTLIVSDEEGNPKPVGKKKAKVISKPEPDMNQLTPHDVVILLTSYIVADGANPTAVAVCKVLLETKCAEHIAAICETLPAYEV
jgi:hypothetical protein